MTRYERLSLIVSFFAVVVSMGTTTWQISAGQAVNDALSAEYEYQRSDEGVTLTLYLTNVGKEKVYVTELSSGYVKNSHFTSDGIGGEYEMIEKPFEPGEQRRYQFSTVNSSDLESEYKRLRHGFFISLTTSRKQRITLSGFAERFKQIAVSFPSFHPEAIQPNLALQGALGLSASRP